MTIEAGAVEVRPAAADDLPACADIVNDWIDATPWMNRVASREAIHEAVCGALDARRTIWVGTRDGAVVGYLSMDAQDFVHGLYLAPHAAGSGLGRRLVDAAKEHSPQGLRLTVFEPNADARRFYDHVGFREVPDAYTPASETEEGIATVMMEWRPEA